MYRYGYEDFLMDLQLRRNMKGGDYAEFNMAKHYRHWDDSSLFLKDEVFATFFNCFNTASSKFNYYGATLYSGNGLEKLLSELKNHLQMLKEVTNFASFSNMLTSYPMGVNFIRFVTSLDCDVQVEWRKLVNKLIEINEGLIEIVQDCLKNDQILWVLGI